MKTRFQSLLFPVLIAGFASTSVHADPLVAGAQIGIDFGPTAPDNTFNQVNPDPSGPGSIAAGGLVTTTNVTVDGVGFSWAATNPFFNNNDSISIAGQPAEFNESNLTDWIGISKASATTIPGVITLTFTGLNDALTYDVIVGAGFASGIADTTWASGSKSGLSDISSGPNSFVTLTDLSTDGSGSLVITGTGTIVGTRADLAVVSALHLTAVGTVSESFQLTITPAIAPATGFDLEWESQTGKLYNLRTSPDITGAISTWTLVEGGIEATPPTNTYSVDPADPRRFYAVEEFDAPPLFTTDFEAGDAGFTVSPSDGTAWELGTPDSDNGQTPPNSLVLTAGKSGTNAWGTNLGTGDAGFYTNPTTTSLRSPIIDLSDATSAALTFAEAVDFSATDSAELYVISDSDDSVVAGPIHTSSTGAVRTAGWAVANGGTPIALPPAAIGQAVRLEWRFTGSADNFLGWYIDDVLVTETTP